MDVTLITAREISRLVPEDMVINLIHAELLVLNTDTSPSRTTDNASVTTVTQPPRRLIRELLINIVTKEEWDKVMLGEMPSIKTLNGIEEDHSLV